MGRCWVFNTKRQRLHRLRHTLDKGWNYSSMLGLKLLDACKRVTKSITLTDGTIAKSWLLTHEWKNTCFEYAYSFSFALNKNKITGIWNALNIMRIRVYYDTDNTNTCTHEFICMWNSTAWHVNNNTLIHFNNKTIPQRASERNWKIQHWILR